MPSSWFNPEQKERQVVWAILALMIVGSICAGLLEAHATNEQPDTSSDDEFTHQEGDDYGE